MIEVEMTVGVPGCGKSTYALKKDPSRWVRLELDVFRTVLWGHRQVYWDLRRAADPVETLRLQTVLHRAYAEALSGVLRTRTWNVILSNTHVFQRDVDSLVPIFLENGVVSKVTVFDAPLPLLLARNDSRPSGDRLKESSIIRYFDEFSRPDAWWRSVPHELIQVREY